MLEGFVRELSLQYGHLQLMFFSAELLLLLVVGAHQLLLVLDQLAARVRLAKRRCFRCVVLVALDQLNASRLSFLVFDLVLELIVVR